MKKYITTDKAKILREGVQIEQDSINPGLYFVSGWKSVYSFNDDAIETMLRLDELKEIQEPKWTDDDMKDIVRSYINTTGISYYEIDTFFESYKKSKQ